MKKTLSLLLAVLLMLGCMTFTAAAGQTAPEEDFEFSDGVIKKYLGRDSDVVIPATIGGVPVTSIALYPLDPSISDEESEFSNSLISVTIPEGVTSIGEYAFLDCQNLKSVTLPDGLLSIGGAAFFGCESLTSVTIPGTVTSIGDNAFNRCNFSSVTIPDSVISIEQWAFCGNYNMTSVTVNWTSLDGITFGENIFLSVDLTKATLHVPAGTESMYEASAFGKQFGTIKELPPEGVSVTLTPSKEEINAGETVTITVTAEGAQNCADITLTYDANTFDYTGAADDGNGVTAFKVSDDTIRILNADTAETINTLTFTSKSDLTETVEEAKFEITSAKFAESRAAMKNDAEAAAAVNNTAVKVNVLTVTVQKDYVHGTEATSYTKIIVTGDLAGYTYNGNAMYKVADKTFAYIVPTTDKLKADNAADYAKSLVAASDTAADDISVTDANDVNDTDKVDIADARAVYICVNNEVSVADYMAVYIRADVNGDGKIDTDDVAAVINELK